ncbi:hypothetical protein [Qipengyuania sp. ASV99]|uniref:hypothetical protein n=1 Tax=Qipengyuania sp. ASV99 TaxID=3399681 RepID=UPI003A4C5C1D
MPSLLALTAPLALILPLLGHGAALAPRLAEGGGSADAPRASAPDYDVPPDGPYSPAFPSARPATSPLDAFYGGQVARQVRIEQRVIIRISPQRPSNTNSLLARLPQRGLSTRYEEREMDRCLPVGRISGVQTGTGNRLLLFLNDDRIVSVNLERACRARDFYSGFYVERSDDGQLCSGRDELQSRSGAKCEVQAMRQLVAVND